VSNWSNRRLRLLAALAAPALLWGRPGAAGESQPSDSVILDTKSFWRFRTVWETPELVLPSGEAKHALVNVKGAYDWFQKNPTQGQLPESQYTMESVSMVRLPAETPADWMNPDFDDSAWARLRGPMLAGSFSENWKLILMRGLFEVGDPSASLRPAPSEAEGAGPARAAGLTLSLAFRGGAVVYLNGEEVARAFVPKGGLYAPAEPYSEEVYFSSDGFALYRYDKTEDGRRRIEKRVRKLTDCRIPATRLRKGVNVLAAAICRAPTPVRFYASRPKGSGTMHDDCFWAKLGLLDVRLAAPAGAAVVPNTGPLPGRGFKVWNQSQSKVCSETRFPSILCIQTMFLTDYPDPFSSLSPQPEKGTGTFWAKPPSGLSGKTYLSPFPPHHRQGLQRQARLLAAHDPERRGPGKRHGPLQGPADLRRVGRELHFRLLLLGRPTGRHGRQRLEHVRLLRDVHAHRRQEVAGRGPGPLQQPRGPPSRSGACRISAPSEPRASASGLLAAP
jgi:hypothetical protein